MSLNQNDFISVRWYNQYIITASFFLLEGTLEEKVYSRSVNKSGLAARIVDQRNPQRNFTKKELENVLEVDNWVQCNKCEKWRMLPPNVDPENLPDKWYCSMNEDVEHADCSIEERDDKFYHKYFAKKNQVNQENDSNAITPEVSKVSKIDKNPDTPVDDTEKETKTKRDQILSKILEGTRIISKYNFHDSMLKDAK